MVVSGRSRLLRVWVAWFARLERVGSLVLLVLKEVGIVFLLSS